MAKINLFGQNPNPQPAREASRPRAVRPPTSADQLFPCAFRGIPFPITRMSVSWAQDMVEHKYVNVDGARVEMTGRAPLTFEAEIPYVNGIAPGKNERWGVLWPNGFMDMLNAMNDKSTGLLDTPQFLNIVVKPVSFEYTHDANVRDGVMATARWVETIDKEEDANDFVFPVEEAYLAALNLDNPELQGIPGMPAPTVSFEQLMNELTGVVDTTASRIKLLLNKPAQIIYNVRKIERSIERVANPLTWPGREAVDSMMSAARDLERLPEKIEAAVTRRKTQRYVSTTRMTLSQLAQVTKNSVDDLINLNPSLASRPAVPAGTTVRYYASNVNILSQFT